MGTLRSKETQARYDRERKDVAPGGCALCDEREGVHEFEHWRIIENLYPYDRVARVHHMLVSKRHASDTELTEEEWAEFRSIKGGYLQTEYEFIIEPTLKMKSIPAHSHIHMIIPTP